MTGDESGDDIALDDRWWLNGSRNVYLASPQISQEQVTLSPICIGIVGFTAVLSVFTQCSSPQTAVENRTTFL